MPYDKSAFFSIIVKEKYRGSLPQIKLGKAKISINNELKMKE
jgi:hypothetical protein